MEKSFAIRIFNNLDYSFVAGYEDGTFEADSPGHGSETLRVQLGVLKRFLESCDFTHFLPSAVVVRHAPGFITRTLAYDGKEYAIYVEGNGPGSLSLNLPPGAYRVGWINTKNGTTEKTERLEVGDLYTSIQSPVFVDDIALRITRVE